MKEGGYIAEVYAGDAATTVCLGSSVAATRRLALRCLRAQALRFAAALDPDPRTQWIPPRALQLVSPTGAERDAPAELRFWATDDKHQDHASCRLAAGLRYLFLARDETCWYALTARPLLAPAPARVLARA